MTSFRAAFGVAALTAGWFAAAAVSQPPPAAEAELDLLLTASHGLSWGSGIEIERTLAKVIAEPAAYLPLIATRAHLPPDLERLIEPEYFRRSGILIDLLSRIEAPQARRILETWYLETTERLPGLRAARVAAAATEARALAQGEGVVEAIHHLIVEVFRARKDPALETSCLERLAKESPGVQVTLVAYLLTVAPSDPAFRDVARRMLADPSAVALEPAIRRRLREVAAGTAHLP